MGKPGTVTLKIEHTDPEKTSERLAIKLAEAYNNMTLFERQAIDYKRQANDERRKGTDIQGVIMRLKDWKKQLERDLKDGVERKISRMEPMMSYDSDALQKELEMYKENSIKFHKMSDEFQSQANQARRDTVVLQLEIKKANAPKLG